VRRALSRWAALLVAASVLLGPRYAIGKPDEATCGVGRPWVLMEVSGLDRAFAARLISDLRAGLRPSRVDACPTAPVRRREPLATVKIVPSAADPLTVSIDVSDSVTQKRIGRDVDLAHVPADGRAFALAVAAEELLRASWAELALDRDKASTQARPPEPPPRKPPPPRPLPPPPPASEPSYDALGVAFGFEHYGGGQTHFGADLFWLHPVFESLFVRLGAGARRALSVDAPHGTVSAAAAGAELALYPVLLSLGAVRLDALVALRGLRVWYGAKPAVGAISQRGVDYALYGRAGLALSIGRVGSVRSISTLGAGGPFRSFSAADAGEVVTGVSGVEVFATSGVALEF